MTIIFFFPFFGRVNFLNDGFLGGPPKPLFFRSAVFGGTLLALPPFKRIFIPDLFPLSEPPFKKPLPLRSSRKRFLSDSPLPGKIFFLRSSRKRFLSSLPLPGIISFPSVLPRKTSLPCLSENDGCEYSLNKRKKPKRSAPALPEKIFCSAPPGSGEAVLFPGQKRPKSRRSARPFPAHGAFECCCSAKRDLLNVAAP